MSEKKTENLTVNNIPVLLRREIEARILRPFLEKLCQRFPEEKVLEALKETIWEIAQEQGKELRERMGGNSLEHFKKSQEAWRTGGAVEIEVIKDTPSEYSYLVHRCLYAELYDSLGLKNLGFILSCMRDFPLIEGFNPEIKLERKGTIMEGSPTCDFRYFLKSKGE
ncbi:MAG: L-2-amino-thiazoline-4-carboxylic acid hydrolase [Caldiserica bacterium]|jgi:hypothetical protein|nr:L-2-amino-thiazoline-4-carboxylic acid hydrolase [Caldisericota bacterium]MDH7562523.1 L-2-amino-thiazoline-4-carboxylic acid hydrolase [Caldisericota bacterium]